MTARPPEYDLYDFLQSLSIDSVSADAVSACEALILDHFSCALLGQQLPWTKIVRATAAQAEPGPRGMGPAFVYGEAEPVSPRTAALVNGTATHAFDLDDLYFPAMSHPGCIINPAAFAAATSVGAGGPALIASIIAGYELMARVGAAVGVKGGELGFHATGQQGPMAAAATVSRLFGASPGQLANAVGIAASLGGGIKAFTSGNGMVKRLHAGRAAESGVYAASLARNGFEGPRAALSATYGFVKVFAVYGPEDFGALTDGLGDALRIEDIYIKPFAACGALHGALVAAEMVRENATFDPGGITQVIVGTSRRALEQNSIPRPTDLMTAQYSMEYCVALALLGRIRDAAALLDLGTARDEDVRRLAATVSMKIDDRAEAAYPDSNESSIEVHFADGRVLSTYGQCDESSSSGWAVAKTKFIETTAKFLTASAQQQLLDAIRGLCDGGPVAACLAALPAAPA